MSSSMDPSATSLNVHLREYSGAPDDLRHLIVEISRVTKYIHHAIRSSDTGLADSSNQFGEKQLKLDVIADELLCKHLTDSKLVACYASEEQEQLVSLHDDAPFTVVFDPLDGSSLVDANFAIGSIFGIYEGKDVIGRTPREQVGALYALYGPRTTLIYSTGKGVHEFMLNDVGEFVLLRENIEIHPKATNYSPGNLRALETNEQYRALFHEWLDRKLTLRYSGCMVADIHHIFSKHQGIFTNLGGDKYPEGKLRLVFECGPFSYLMEHAGGKGSDGCSSILDATIKELDQRIPLVIGSTDSVVEAESYLST